MRNAPTFRRFVLVLLTAVTGAMLLASCAASGPKYGCPGAVNQSSKYAHD